ncbi:MAG: 3-keto-disaccharide hydrolase [Bacteroidota bacterium]
MKQILITTIMMFIAASMVGQKEISLFNGKNLDGWEKYGQEKWYVEDGLLVCESGPEEEYGYLATEDEYKDFVLELDFKQVSDGNSGVFFRSSLDGTKISGWQVEVAPPGNDTGGIYESYGRGWLEKIPESKEDILKMGEWNHMKIRIEGDNVTTWLNGKKMVSLSDEKIGKANGKIALQIHSGGGIKVLWKNINLKFL